MSLSPTKFTCVTVASTCCIIFLHNLSLTDAGVLSWAGDKIKNKFSVATTTQRYPGKSSSCECACGVANEDTRIVGGKPSEPNEFPWMVRLSYFNRFYCGGTLVNDKYVVTAAHCVKGFLWFLIKVTLGEHDRCNQTKKPESRFVLRVFAGNFSFFNFDNDIAILRLNDRVPLTDTIRPICLPPASADDKTYEGRVAKLAGWGTLEEGGKPACILRTVDVPIINHEKCASQYPDGMVTANMMCAGYDEGQKDSCQGDSGGPLMIQREDKRFELAGSIDVMNFLPFLFTDRSFVTEGKLKIISFAIDVTKYDNNEFAFEEGVVSWGNGCARPKYPGVYSIVSRYISWIEENSQDACFCEK